MTNEEYQGNVFQYERKKRDFEIAHEKWRARLLAGTTEKQTFHALATIASFILIILALLNWRTFASGKIIGVIFWISVFFNSAEKWDSRNNRQRLENFLRQNPEPVFDVKPPVWIDNDFTQEEVCDSIWSEEPSPRRILGVEEKASLDEIKKAYRRRIRQCHPDKLFQVRPEAKQAAEERAKALNVAYAAILAEGA